MSNEDTKKLNEDSKKRSLRRIVTLAIFLVVATIAYRLGRQESPASPAKEMPRSEAVQEALIETNEIAHSLQEIHARIGPPDKQVTVADELFLIRSQAFFKRIDEQRVLWGRPELQAHAAIQQGHISWLMNRHNDAETSFRNSISWLEGLSQRDRDFGTLIELLNASNSLSCVLCEKGHLEEAAKFAQKVITLAQAASGADTSGLEPRWQQAIGYRNLAIALQIMGQDGTAAASNSTKLFAELSASASERPLVEQVPILECLVDSYQLQALLYDQSHDDIAARETCIHSLREFERLLSICEKLSKRNVGVDWSRLQTVENQLRRNLGLVQTGHLDQGSQTRPSGTPFSQCVLLNGLQGSALHPDQILRGIVAGEFQQQEAIALVWPELPDAKSTIVEIISSLCQHVQIVLLVENSLLQSQATESLKLANIPPEAIDFIVAPTETFWLRDYGPLAVHNSDGSPMYVDAKYNLFGGKRRFQDDHVPAVFGQYFETPILRTPMIMEWGGIAFNGSGLVLVSTYLLELNRDIGIDEQQVTKTLKRLTGAKQVVYLDPLQNEPTGHLDWFLTFTSPDTLVLGDNTNGNDSSNAKLLDRHARRLAGMPTENGPLNVVRIPMPPRGREWFGGTYTNVVYANGVLLVPSWPKTAPRELEQEALAVYRRLLPGWKIISIDSESIGRHAGSLHCVTMNVPSSPRATNVSSE